LTFVFIRRHVTFIVTVIELTGSPIWDLFFYYNFTTVFFGTLISL